MGAMFAKYSGVIFDLDGTLLDTLEDIAAATNRALETLGERTYPLDDFRTLVGDGVAVLFLRAIPSCQLGSELHNQAMELFQEYYAQEWNKRSKPYDGIDDLLFSLQEAQIPLTVLSNKLDEFTKKCVGHYFPSIRFCRVDGQRTDVPRKPDPEGVHIIARELATSPDRIAYVGDTNTDMETAVRAGCFAIGVTWGFRTVDELLLAGAQAIVNHPSEIISLLLE
jgi:phosphoglycolate phosphatase